jgi:hypothetical protein
LAGAWRDSSLQTFTSEIAKQTISTFDLEFKRQEEYYLSNQKSSNKVLNYGSKLPACLSQVTLMKIPKNLSTVSVIK